MIFDFRGKNVKANLAVQSTPFGLPRSSLNGSINQDDDFNYKGSLEVPEPCGIVFEGECVIIGKGSLLVNRNKKVNKKKLYFFLKKFNIN